jgi:endonuclease YncB( thermonuclease family)
VVDKVFSLYAAIVRWHDGDTFYGVIDQGWYSYMGTTWKPVSCRILGINTPELRVNSKPNPAGLAALDYARILAPEGSEFRCLSYKPPGLGAGFAIGARPVLDLVLPDGSRFAEAMMAMGHAVPEPRRTALA